MDYKELLEKYNLLFRENTRLRKENSQLKAQIQVMNSEFSQNKDFAQDTEVKLCGVETIDVICNSDVITNRILFQK